MRLAAVILENFRGFKSPTRIDFDSLTGIVGRNDVGKSSILEALDIFFDGGACSIDPDDLCKDAGGAKCR
jgi:Chromosome segregation ATPases